MGYNEKMNTHDDQLDTPERDAGGIPWHKAEQEFERAWRNLNDCDDAPSNKTIALTGLRVILPQLVDLGLLHNYRYREVAAIEQFGERLNANRKSIHGADGSARIDIEVKTGAISAKANNITASVVMGMFDKIHARVSMSRVMDVKRLKEAIDHHDMRSGGMLPFGIDGETWSTEIALTKVRNALTEAISRGMSEVRLPAILKSERLTSGEDVKIINFCLFPKDGVYPLLTIETTTEDLEHHLSGLFEQAVHTYHTKMSARSSKEAPSARDGLGITLRQLMDMGRAAKLVHLDTQAMTRRNLWLADDVLQWATRSGTPEIRTRLARLIESRATRPKKKGNRQHSSR